AIVPSPPVQASRRPDGSGELTAYGPRGRMQRIAGRGRGQGRGEGPRLPPVGEETGGNIGFAARGQAMRIFFVPVAILVLPAFIVAAMFAAEPAKAPIQFEGKDTLLRPDGYREWVFVGSSLGLRDDEGKKQAWRLEHQNVYIDPAAYRAYKETGAFPEGTVLVLETAVGEEKNEPGLRGSFQKEF